MTDSYAISKEELLRYIERIERINEDKEALMEDMRNLMSEAKSSGFDTKTLKQIIKLRKLNKDTLAEQEALLELYREVIGV